MLFYRFIRKHVPGLRILPLSNTRYEPGAILDPESLRLLGHGRDILTDEPEETWRYGRSDASIIYGTLSLDRKLGGGARILGVFSLKASVKGDLRVSLDISEIKGSYLKTSQLLLQPRFNELRRTDRRGRWRMINGNFVVMEAYYASKFEARFLKDNELMGKSELERSAGLDVNGSVEFRWANENVLVIACNDKLPFGVRGFTV